MAKGLFWNFSNSIFDGLKGKNCKVKLKFPKSIIFEGVNRLKAIDGNKTFFLSLTACQQADSALFNRR